MRIKKEASKIKPLHSSHVTNDSWNDRPLFDASNAFRRVTSSLYPLSISDASFGIRFMAGGITRWYLSTGIRTSQHENFCIWS